MSRILVTYANEKYKGSQKKLICSAKRLNYFDKTFEFSPDDIDFEFKENHKEILSCPRGNGLWLWKPYFINRVLNTLEDNDILFYCDSGAFFVKSPKKLEKYFSNIFISSIPLSEKQFTKKLVFENLNVNKVSQENNQMIATYLMIKKNPYTQKIMKEWLELCENKLLLEPSDGHEENQCFIAHREDQSLLSILCKKYNIKPNCDITQRVYIPYTYWNPSYYFRIEKHEPSFGVVLYLHKQANPTISSLLHLIIKQFYINIKYYYLASKRG